MTSFFAQPLSGIVVIIVVVAGRLGEFYVEADPVAL